MLRERARAHAATMTPSLTLDEWHAAGVVLARRMLATGLGAYRLADLAFRHGVLQRFHGERLRALDAIPGREARAAAERAFCAGWDEVVDGAIRERVRGQTL